MNSSAKAIIDLNCDLGEGIGNDELIMPFISSANIACGYHAGDEKTIRDTVQLCLKYGVAIGAHPSFFDRENFGRREIELSETQIYDLLILQLRLVDRIAEDCGGRLTHVKPHGALYNLSGRAKETATAIAKAVKDFDESLVLFGLANSCSITEAKNYGLKTASEVFADRTYQDDGSLTPRSQPGALIEDPAIATMQALQMVIQGTVKTTSGKIIQVAADTICIHGDGEHAVEFAKAVHDALLHNEIDIAPAWS